MLVEIGLICAGEHTVTAEFKDARPEFLPSRRSRQEAIQAMALALHICPGPATTLTLESQTQGDRLTVTNGEAEQERLLLKQAALQVPLSCIQFATSFGRVGQ